MDLSSVVNSPDLAEPFTIFRSSGGSFGPGGWQDKKITISAYGVIDNAQGQDLDQIPEGDRVVGAIVVHTSAPLYVTHNDQTPGLSDIVVWHGQQWRMHHLDDRSNRGFYRGVALRMSGE